jgi:hypothetical protein
MTQMRPLLPYIEEFFLTSIWNVSSSLIVGKRCRRCRAPAKILVGKDVSDVKANLKALIGQDDANSGENEKNRLKKEFLFCFELSFYSKHCILRK